MLRLFIEEFQTFVSDCVAHFCRRAMVYRKILLLAALLSVFVNAFNIYFQIVGIYEAEAANLSAEPISPAGIFYAPREIRVGQETSIKSLTGYLREAGYSEVKSENKDFAPGSFQISGASFLKLRTDFPGIAADLSVEFSKAKISRIVADGVEVQSAKLPPKPITNLSYSLENEEDAEMVVNSPVYLIPVRNFELEDTTVKAVLCSSEGRCDLAVSVKGISRAAVRNAEKRFGLYDGKTQGGSTPCQQLIKNVKGDSSYSFMRKIKEIYTCSDLVRRLSPPELFQSYANIVSIGVSKTARNIVGVQTAAIEIFGKNAKDLDLAESSFLAALIPEPRQLPKLWSKKYNAAAWEKMKAKQATILDNVLKKNPKRFTSAEIEAAKQKKITFAWDTKPKTTTLDRLNAPIVQLAAQEFSAFRSKQKSENLVVPYNELRVLRGETNIDESLMRAGQKILNTRLAEIQKKFPPVDEKTGKPANDSLVGVIGLMSNDTGNLVALVVAANDPKLEVSKIYAEHGVDPCSQFKPFTYSCALEQSKLTLLTLINPQDGKIKQLNGKIWQPSGGVGDRLKTVAEGVAGSDDGVAVFVANNILGLENTVDFFGNATGNYAKPNVSKTGEKEFSPVNSLGFGIGLGTNALEFLESYSAFARGGQKQKASVLSKVFRGSNNIELPDTSEDRKQIFSAETAYLMFWAMRGAVGVGPFGNFGTAANLPQKRGELIPFPKYLQSHPEVQVACKTGSGARNVGISCVSPRFTVTTQLFYAKNSLFRQVGGSDIYAAQSAGVIWSDFMNVALKIKPELFIGEIVRPANIVEIPVDLLRNCQTASGTLVPFKVGTEPKPCSEIGNDSASISDGKSAIVIAPNGVDLRIDKNIESESVAFVPAKGVVGFLSCDNEKVVLNGRESRWCRVKYGDKIGFISGWDIYVLPE